MMSFVPRLAGALLALACAAVVPVHAQGTYPDKPIRLIVPFPPGGGADNLARTIVPKAAEILGQAIVIENKPGAGGNIGAAEVARAAPDGYTLLQGTNGTHGINQALYANPGLDALKDFTPVARWTMIPAMLVVNPSVPAQNVRELIAWTGLGESRQGLVRVGRQRHDVAPRGRPVQERDRHRHRPRSVQGRRPGADRPHGRRRADDDRPDGERVSERQGVGRIRLGVTTLQRVSSAPELPTLDESPGCRASRSRPPTAFTRRPARRARSSRSSTPRSARRSRIRR